MPPPLPDDLPPPDDAWALTAIQATIRLGLVGSRDGGGLAPTHLGLLVAAVLEQLTADLLAELFEQGYLRALDPDDRPPVPSGVTCARYYDDPRRGGTELLAPTPEDYP